MAYSTKELQLIRGAADVAPKFADYGKEIDKFQENLKENARLRQKQLDVEKKENDLRSEQYLAIDNVDTVGLGGDVLSSTTQYAADLKNQAFDLIKNKGEMGVTEFNVQYASLLKDVEGLNGMNKIKKALGTQYIEAMKNDDVVPWTNPDDLEKIQMVIDQDAGEKKWVKKDGKFFLSVTKDGKTTDINMADLKPLETADPSIYLRLEDEARKRLKAYSLNPGSLDETRIRSVAEKTVAGLTDQEAKNAALYYVLKNSETGATADKNFQRQYFTPPPGVSMDQHMLKIRKDIENTLYDRELSLYAQDLNKSKMPKPPRTSDSDKDKKGYQGNYLTSRFVSEFQKLYGKDFKRNPEGGVVTADLQTINPKVLDENGQPTEEIKRLANSLGYKIGAILGGREGIEFTKQGETGTKSFQILAGSNASQILNRLHQAEGATLQEADRYTYAKNVQDYARNFFTIAGGFKIDKEKEADETDDSDELPLLNN